MGSKYKATVLTTITKLISSISGVLFSLVYMKLMLQNYGSTVNGLVSTLTQFVLFFSFVEGGFNTAVIVATYEPLGKKNFQKLNNILFTARKIFLRIGIIICVLTLTFGAFYIRYIDSPYSYFQTFILLLLCIFTSILSLCGLSQYTILLQSDNKEFLSVIFTLIARVVTWALSIAMILGNCDILLLYSVNFLNVALNLLIIKTYEKKHYAFATYKGEFIKNLITGTKDIMIQKIANTIFNATDLILISTCISLAAASVYNIYTQIFNAILVFLSAFASSPFNSFGQLAHEDNKENLLRIFKLYQKFILVISALMLSVTGCLVLPFIRIYTVNITDYNYIYPGLAILFFSYNFFRILNQPYGVILNATGNFQMQNVQCCVGAALNIVISLTCVWFMGLAGVILGSLIATFVIFVMNIIKVYKYVILQNPLKELLNILINYTVALGCIVATLLLKFKPDSYLFWIIYAIILFVVNILIFVVLNLITDFRQTLNTAVFFSDNVKRLLKR